MQYYDSLSKLSLPRDIVGRGMFEINPSKLTLTLDVISLKRLLRKITDQYWFFAPDKQIYGDKA